jgi:hypothetical protein
MVLRTLASLSCPLGLRAFRDGERQGPGVLAREIKGAWIEGPSGRLRETPGMTLKRVN